MLLNKSVPFINPWLWALLFITKILDDVRKIDRAYSFNYLRVEYKFVQASDEMVGKWKSFLRDGDRYYLQCRTAHDGRVRPEHAALYGVTLPMTNPFCEELCPPNRWNCRCTVAQVRRSRYQATPYDEAMALGKQALRCDSLSNPYLCTAKINFHWFFAASFFYRLIMEIKIFMSNKCLFLWEIINGAKIFFFFSCEVVV